MRRGILIGAILVLVAAGFYFKVHRASEALSHHAPAPDFSLPDLNGHLLQLSSYRGKVVLLDFWATWCDSCRGEIPHFVTLQNKYGAQGFQMIGVSMDDSPDPVRDYCQRLQMNYPVVMGNAEIGKRYGGILGLPIAFVISADGRIYAKHTGATQASVFEHDVTQLLAQKPR
ncbi:MAG: TlpA disulfide reductase family protein [Candidatus Sulfotelmatobacter sp.]